jgi:hypothetical protein
MPISRLPAMALIGRQTAAIPAPHFVIDSNRVSREMIGRLISFISSLLDGDYQ